MGRTISTEELFGSQDNSSSAPDFQQTPDGKRVFSTKALFGEPKSKVVSSGDLFGPASHLPEFDPKDPEPATKKANALEKMVWTNWAGIPEDAVDQFKAREPAAKEKLANAILGPLAAAIPGQTGRSARENLIFGLAPLAEPFSRFVERPLASQLVPLARNWFLNEPLPTAEAPGFIKQFIPQAADPQVWGALNNLMKAYFTVKPQEIEHVKGYEFGKERPEFGDIFSARNIALGIDPKIGKPLAALGGLALRSVMPDIAAGAKKITTAAGETAGKAGAAVGDVAKGVAQAVEAEIQNAYKIFKGTTDKQTFVKMMVEQKGMPVDGAKQLAGAFEKFIKDNPQSTSFQPDYAFRSLFPGVQERPGFIVEAPTKAASNLSAEVNAVRAEAKQLQAKADELAQAGKPTPKDLTETINKLNASIPQPEATGRESEKVQAADKIQQEIEALKGRKSKKDIQKREELDAQLETVAPVEEAPEEQTSPDIGLPSEKKKTVVVNGKTYFEMSGKEKAARKVVKSEDGVDVPDDLEILGLSEVDGKSQLYIRNRSGVDEGTAELGGVSVIVDKNDSPETIREKFLKAKEDEKKRTAATKESLQGWVSDEKGNLVKAEAPKEPDAVLTPEEYDKTLHPVTAESAKAESEQARKTLDVIQKYKDHLEFNKFTQHISADQQVDNLKKQARLKTIGGFESYLNLRTNTYLRDFLKENNLSIQEFRDAMSQAPDYVPQEKPKTESKITVKKARLEYTRQGIIAHPIDEKGNDIVAKTPYEMGKEAFAKGLKSVPIHDKDFVQAQGGNAYKMDMEAIKQWSKGWHEANLAAPVPEEKPAPKVTPQVKEGVAGSTPLGVKPDTLKTPGEFYIRTFDGKEHFKKVFGEPVKIADYIETFVHKVKRGLWHVSEVTTGQKVGEGANKEGAVERARINLENAGEQKVKDLIAGHIKRGFGTPLAKQEKQPQPEKGAILKPEGKDDGTSKETAGRDQGELDRESARPASESGDANGLRGDATLTPRDTGELQGQDSTSGRGVVEEASRESSPEDRDVKEAYQEAADTTREKIQSEYDGNYKITPEDNLGKGTPKQKYKENVTAIKVLKQIEAEKREATKEEQAILVKYVGWGGLKQAFDPENESWRREFEELKSLLSEKEYAAARASVTNAHYTSSTVINAMWQAVKRLGFKSGHVLEPGMGSGNFLGLRPSGRISFTGVELDSLTGRIAKQLYQDADIHISGFEDANLSRNYYDLAISNVPFASTQPVDRRAKELGIPAGLSLHDFFFAKALALVRPGGVVAFITSRYTMDKQSKTFRENIAQKADFIGAIRLPNTAFKGNAGTEVVTDIIFLQKRMENASDAGKAWTESPEKAIGNALVNVNEYYSANPQMLLGKEAVESGLYSKSEYTLRSTGDLEEQLKAAIEQLPENIFESVSQRESTQEVERLRELLPSHLKEGSYFEKDGKIYQKVNNQEAAPIEFGSNKDKALRFIKIRDMIKDLLHGQQTDTSDSIIKASQKKLNSEYDSFVNKYGPFSTPANQRLFAEDPDIYFITAQEEVDPKTKKVRKSAIFSKRVISPHHPVTKVGSVKEGLLVSLNELGDINIKHIANISGKTEQEVIQELLNTGVVYQNPENEQFETKDAYLSGNVKAKLEIAKRSAKKDERYKPNVQALEKVIPADVPFHKIGVKIGSPWIATSDYEDFLKEFLNAYGVKVNHKSYNGQWEVIYHGGSYKNTETYGIGWRGFNAVDLFEKMANNRAIVVKEKDDNGSEYVVQDMTDMANEKAELIKEAFKDWIWKDQERRDRLEKYYNDHFNTNVKREYDGKHLTFPGMNPEIFKKFRPSQFNGVWRIIQTGKMLMAHAVGSGKTYTMIASAMELRRLGLVRKPMFAVLNSTLPGFVNQFRALYPAANILIADEKNFSSKKRETFLVRLATNDYDAVIITHSAFGLINVSPETYEEFVQQRIDELVEFIREKKAAEGKKAKVAQIETSIKNLRDRIKAKYDESKKDKTLTFEELGVDMLYVDESQEFKNLMFQTGMQGVAGLGNPAGSDRSLDMAIKLDRLQKITNGRGVVFATGTPITNSMSEAYALMKYLQMDRLRDLGVKHFDDWVNQFGTVEAKLEVKPTGSGFRMRTRFRGATNGQQLMGILRDVWDYYSAPMLERDGILRRGFELPTLRTGTPEVMLCEKSEDLDAYIEILKERYKKVLGKRSPKGGDNAMVIVGDGRKASVDVRLVVPGAKDDPRSKLNVCVKNVYNTWKETKDARSTQVVFFDLVKPKSNMSQEEVDELEVTDAILTDFDPNKDMRDKWRKMGIPANEIAFISDASNNAQKQEIFDKVSRGEIRIIVGSRKKLGIGVNIQERLIALHHLDIPWTPGDLTQSDGRGMRSGNTNKEIRIHRYVTAGSYDVNSWQLLEDKALALESLLSGESDEQTINESQEFNLIKALASESPLVMEKTNVDVEVRRLNNLKKGYMVRKAEGEKFLSGYDQYVQKTNEAIKAQEKRLADLPKERPSESNKQFKMNVEGTEHTTKEAAGKAIVSKFEVIMAGSEKKYRTTASDTKAIASITVGQNTYTVFPEGGLLDYPNVKIFSGRDMIGYAVFQGSYSGMVDSIIGRIFETPEKEIAFQKSLLDKATEKKKNIEEDSSSFKYEEELQKMTARQREIDRQLRDEALKKDDEEPPPSTDSIMGDDQKGFAMFFPKDTPVNDEIKGVQFSDPEVEKRFRDANGMTKKEPIIQRLKEMWGNLLAQARRYPTLPNKPEFFVIKQILDKQGLIKKVAQDRAIRALDAVTAGFGPKKLDLFTRKVILDDLIREAKAGRPVPFGYSEFSETSGELIIRIELLEKDKAMIDALIEQNPDVKAGVERRQKLWAAIQQDLVRYKILKESQLKEDYFRHQILEYAQTKAVHGTGKKLRTPNPGYSRQRMGSTFDINTNYLEAEMEVMSQAFHDIETAKNIEAIEKSPLNVLKTLQDRAKTYNATKVMAYFQAFLDREQALGNPEYLGMTAEKLYRRTLNWKQAMGYAKLGKLASEGYLPTGLNNEFQDVVESLAQRHDEGEADEIENGRMFKYLNYLMNAQDEAGKMGAAMVFKGMAEKKQAIIRILGEQIKTWEDFIPEGYRTWQPKEGRVFYSAYSVPQKVVNELLQNAQPELGEYGITKEDLQKVMAVGGLRKQLVLPEEVADTLDDLYTTPQPNFVMEAARAITTKWKQWVLFNPRRFFKYNYQNFVGDSDAVIAGNPKIFRNTARAVRELENVFFLGRPMPTEMREFFERGGISSTLTIQEIPDVKKLEIFKRFFSEAEKAKSQNLVASIMNGYWSKAVEFTVFREAILRYAAYLHYRDVFNSGKVEYAASNPEEIDAMENPLDKAAKVATELLGDYANVSAFTQNMRQFLIPFASWLEVNAKRYFRLGKNAYTGADGAGAGASAGGRLAGVALKKGALGLSAWWLRAAAMTGLVMLYNQLFWGDEESEVSPYDQNRMHLILGRMKDGRIVILRGQGAFSDILEWFGLDAAPQLWREFFEGKASLVDIFGKIPFVTGQIGLKPVFQKIIRGVTPLYKIPFETMTGRTLPVFDDRPGKIEDPVRNILKGISLENEYDKLTGRPTRGYFRSLLESFVAIQDPMENAYRYIQSQKYEYLEKWKGRGGMSDYYSPRSIVYRQYKKALVFKDKDAEERSLAEIRKLGTTAKQFQSSMKAADPLYGLSKADKQEFTQKFLMPRDKAKLEKALTYYKKTFGGSRD